MPRRVFFADKGKVGSLPHLAAKLQQHLAVKSPAAAVAVGRLAPLPTVSLYRAAFARSDVILS